jgi:hypothetical protein
MTILSVCSTRQELILAILQVVRQIKLVAEATQQM